MSRYLRDRETGKVYAFGGLIGVRTLDDQRSEREDFRALLERRAPELPRRRLTWRQRDRIDYSLGYRADDVTGKVACPECGAENLPDSNYCQACGNPLMALEADQGVQPRETVKCPECDHLNAVGGKFCVSCGETMPLSQVGKELWPKFKLRTPQNDAPVVFARPAAHARDGARSNQQVVARETFDAIDPRTHNVVHVIAGRTRVGDGCWLHKLRPSAFPYV
jgi:hypothetical protein